MPNVDFTIVLSKIVQMKNPSFLFVFLICVKLASGIECDPLDDCQCFGDEIDDCQCFGDEIQCPKNWNMSLPGVVLHIKEDEIIIDCYNLDEFPKDLLPNITANGTEKIEIRTCRLPQNFKNIFKHFSIKPKELHLENDRNVVLKKQNFENLESLEKVILNTLEFISVDPQVFKRMSNLTCLEIERSNNLTLPFEIFNGLYKLKILSLGQNQLELLPDFIFKDLKNLYSLTLRKNNITKVTNLTLDGLSNLEILDLGNNKIEEFSTTTLKDLKRLISIDLSRNRLTKISHIFHENANLKEIHLSYNEGLVLPKGLFSQLTELVRIGLAGCNLSDVPDTIFENSSNLTNIDLNRNTLEKFPPFSFDNLEKLEVLNLERNLIKEIPSDSSLSKLSSLNEINLRRNNISTIENKAFDDVKNLRKVYLSENFYKGDNKYAFYELEQLEELDLRNNLISSIDSVILDNAFHLDDLNLSNNSIEELKFAHFLKASKDDTLSVDLSFNKIFKIDIGEVENVQGEGTTKIIMKNNILKCDCKMYEFYKFLRDEKYESARKMFVFETKELICETPPKLKGMSLKDISSKGFVCGDLKYCPVECTCSYRPHDLCLVINCDNRNLTNYPVIKEGFKNNYKIDQIELHLENNNLQVGPASSSKDFFNVTKLYLSNNNISRIEWLPPELKELYLDNNYLQGLSDSTLEFLKTRNLSVLTLNNNRWACDCTSANLTNFIRTNRGIKNADKILCYGDNRALLHLGEAQLCMDYLVYYIVFPLLIICFILSCFLAFFIYKDPLKVWLYANNCCLWWVTEEELDKGKTYDAFISYSTKDEDFVVQNLLPVLEGGPKPYKLCIHYRNFIPGEFIATQVTNAVLDSRRTLVVLSINFLESIWGKMEFRTAHTQAMTEGRARVIIVLYGDIDLEKLDGELKAYLKTNTYVKWGDPYFWSKLRYALPHSRKASGNNQKMANVMSYIDDKFKLVVPQTPDPGSTPPVLTGESDPKKNIFSLTGKDKL